VDAREERKGGRDERPRGGVTTLTEASKKLKKKGKGRKNHRVARGERWGKGKGPSHK